jgi:hypothetical protein
MMRLLAVLVSAGLVLSACGNGSSPSPVRSAPAVLDAAFRCPGPHSDAHGDGGSDTLPTGATGALLCRRENHSPWTSPRGVLTTDLDRVVAVVDRQRVHDPASNVGCGGVGAPAWTMVLRYPTGTRTISGDNGGCWDLLVGATRRFGSRRVYAAYLRALLRQRDAAGPPAVRPKAPPCPVRRSPADPALFLGAPSPAARSSDVVSGTWCVLHGREWRPVRTATRAQLAVLRHDIRTSAGRRQHDVPDDRCAGLPPSTSTLLAGRDAWGDVLEVDVTCDAYRLTTPPHPRAEFVQMLPATARLLAGLRAQGGRS